MAVTEERHRRAGSAEEKRRKQIARRRAAKLAAGSAKAASEGALAQPRAVRQRARGEGETGGVRGCPGAGPKQGVQCPRDVTD